MYCCLKQNNLYRWEEDHFDLLWNILSNLKNNGFYKHTRINEIFQQNLFIWGCHRVTYQPTHYANLTSCKPLRRLTKNMFTNIWVLSNISYVEFTIGNGFKQPLQPYVASYKVQTFLILFRKCCSLMLSM